MHGSAGAEIVVIILRNFKQVTKLLDAGAVLLKDKVKNLPSRKHGMAKINLFQVIISKQVELTELGVTPPPNQKRVGSTLMTYF